VALLTSLINYINKTFNHSHLKAKKFVVLPQLYCCLQ